MSDPADGPTYCFEDALAECVEEVERRGWDAVEDVVRRHAGWADDLRRRLEGLREMGLLGSRDEGPPQAPRRLGDFRLLDRLGGGGMGVVHRAREESLGRDVALKIMRHESTFFADARTRFRREAEAVARLQHPGIVPIHRAGEEDGVPFLAMELIDGRSAAEAVEALKGAPPGELSGERLRTVLGAEPGALFEGGWPRVCTRIVLQIADALDHAHARGVLHRDVKPSNVMIARAGRAMLVDFGLARAEGSATITASGAVPGSLPYLPPEVLEGGEWSVRADVYALGVTLFELLTLRLPYRGASAEDTRRLILAGRAARPRALNPAVSRDLEAVCLVAMDAEPARRYESAAELAQDLRNVLDGRLVRASPPGSLLRLRRWVARNPAGATALLLAVLLVGGIPSALLVQATRHAGELRASLRKEEEARRSAERERERADEEARNSEATLEFVLELFGNASPYVVSGEELSALDLVRLGSRGVRERFRGDPRTHARVLLSLAGVNLHLERYEEAESLLRDARELYAEHDPESYHHSRALVKHAQVLLQLGRLDEVPPLVEAAGAIVPEEQNWEAAGILGHVAARRGRWDEAERHYQRSLDILGSREPRSASAEAGMLGNLARVALARDRIDLAIEQASRALETLEETLPEPHPEVARARLNLGLMHKRKGDLEEAARLYGEGLRASVELWGEDNVTVAAARINLAGLHEARGEVKLAEKELRRARPVLERVFGAEHRNVVICRGNLAGLLYRRGDFEEAAAHYREVVPLQRDAFGKGHPFVVVSLHNLGASLARTGRHEEALEVLEEVIGLAPRVEGQEHYVLLAQAALGEVRRGLGDMEGARRAFREGLAFAEASLPADHGALRPFLERYLGFCERVGDAETASALRGRLQAP